MSKLEETVLAMKDELDRVTTKLAWITDHYLMELLETLEPEPTPNTGPEPSSSIIINEEHAVISRGASVYVLGPSVKRLSFSGFISNVIIKSDPSTILSVIDFPYVGPTTVNYQDIYLIGLKVRGGNNGSPTVLIRNCSNVVFESCHIHSEQEETVWCGTSQNDGIAIRDSRILNTGGKAALRFEKTSGVMVERCEIQAAQNFCFRAHNGSTDVCCQASKLVGGGIFYGGNSEGARCGTIEFNGNQCWPGLNRADFQPERGTITSMTALDNVFYDQDSWSGILEHQARVEPGWRINGNVVYRPGSSLWRQPPVIEGVR